MKILKTVLLLIAAYGMILSFAHAADDAAKGKASFNDTMFAGATSGKSCNSCHPNGKGLENAGEKHEFRIMGGTQKSLEEVVNVCIENATQGKAIDPSLEQMTDIVAYIKSLKGQEE